MSDTEPYYFVLKETLCGIEYEVCVLVVYLHLYLHVNKNHFVVITQGTEDSSELLCVASSRM